MPLQTVDYRAFAASSMGTSLPAECRARVSAENDDELDEETWPGDAQRTNGCSNPSHAYECSNIRCNLVFRTLGIQPK